MQLQEFALSMQLIGDFVELLAQTIAQTIAMVKPFTRIPVRFLRGFALTINALPGIFPFGIAGMPLPLTAPSKATLSHREPNHSAKSNGNLG
jgi:hypothetical protein